MIRMNKLIILSGLLWILSSCHDTSHKEEPWYRETMEAQQELNIQFSDKDKSPLSPDSIAGFKGLDFFPLDKKYVIKARFEKNEHPVPIEFSTNTDRKPVYIKYGTAYFTLDGKQCQLSLYQDTEEPQDPAYKDVLFIPYTDLTTGNESYGGGRYLDVQIPKGDTVVLNFHKSYNPYCAYDDRWSCTIPPDENDLPVAIYAGVKAYKHGKH